MVGNGSVVVSVFQSTPHCESEAKNNSILVSVVIFRFQSTPHCESEAKSIIGMYPSPGIVVSIHASLRERGESFHPRPKAESFLVSIHASLRERGEKCNRSS